LLIIAERLVNIADAPESVSFGAAIAGGPPKV
jgi:hypothetical protein